jgi:anti-sigma28 factor (negative regulator of flagellin synthesis)
VLLTHIQEYGESSSRQTKGFAKNEPSYSMQRSLGTGILLLKSQVKMPISMKSSNREKWKAITNKNVARMKQAAEKGALSWDTYNWYYNYKQKYLLSIGVQPGYQHAST